MNTNQKSSRRILAATCCVTLIYTFSLLVFSIHEARQNQLSGVSISEEQEDNSGLVNPEAGDTDAEAEDADADSREPGLLFRRLSLQDEKGVIDADGLRKARKQIERMKAVRAQRSKARENKVLEAAIAPDSWTWLGPGNIGGRIRTIAIQPSNANNMFIGSVGGGIWRSINTGSTWSPVNDFMANIAVTTIVYNPFNNSIMYAGTGEGFGNGDALQGAGIFRSLDSGANWTQLANTNNANFNFVNRLAVSPNGNTLLAATNTGVWRSLDAGNNWTLVKGSQFLDVDFHPTDSTRVVAGSLGSAFYSTDGGQNWTAANFQPAIAATNPNTGNLRVEIAYAPSSPSTIYASVNNNNGDLYVSNDSGKNYLRVNTGTNYFLGGAGNQGWYDNALWVNPNDASMVIVGGINLYRSTNGGLALTQISDWTDPTSAHADQHVIVASPNFNNNSNKIVFFGNDGGLYHTNDVANVNTQTWLNNNSQLGITQFYGAAGNQSSGVIVGGAQDNGMLKYNNGAEFWTHMSGGDGGFAAADQTDPNYFYGENQNLVILRSSNSGISSNQITNGLYDTLLKQTNFIAPIALDPNEPNRLLAGGWSLWRTQNAKAAEPDWAAIKGQTGGSSPVSAIAISPTNSAFIVVGHNNGDIYYTFNGTADAPNWTKIDAGLPDRYVAGLVVDPTRSPNWVYATFGGFNADNVYVTKNFGSTWTQVTGTGATALPSVPVRSLVIHPSNPNLLYVGTEVGIFTSEDAGASWDLPNGGPANVSVDELFWMGGDLIAATHGRGLYRASGGLYVDCNYTGTQVGTFDQPFRTINAAINAVTSYRPIWLKPCNYNEQINTNKRLEIRNLGGTARVGTP